MAAVVLGGPISVSGRGDHGERRVRYKRGYVNIEARAEPRHRASGGPSARPQSAS